jgi:hypothetical protein
MEILKISEKQLPGEFQFHSLKVDLRTQNKADVLKCFAQLDFYVTSTTSIVESDEFLFVQDNGRVFSCENAIGSDGYSWVNLRQLEDMVIINRNDVNDANHTDQDGWKWFLTSNGHGYVFAAGNAQQLPRWDKSPLDNVDLKPIQKPLTELMKDIQVIKEWLDPNDHYSYHKASVFGQGSGWIEIPSGSEIAVLLDDKIFFWKDKGQTHWSNAMWNDCKLDTPSVSYFSLKEFMDVWEHSKIIWELLPKTAKLDAEETPKCKNPIIDTAQFILDGELAKKAWANGSKIQISPIQDIPEWEDLNEKVAPLDIFKKELLFRCKPSTILINGTELKPWNSIQVNYEKFIIKIECVDRESADKSYKALQQVFSNRSVNWSKN